jgi:competence protein ComEC
MPFGLDGYCWWLMGAGIDAMIAIALWVTSLPGAVGRIAAFGTGPLLLCSAGILLLCLLRTPLRFAGVALIAIASVAALRAPRPDVLVAAEGGALAVRGADGRLAMIRTGSDTFAFQEWLGADADRRSAKDRGLGGGIRCDGAGCIGRLADGALISFARSAEAFAEDCRRAAVVVSAREAPPGCRALVIDRPLLRQAGAVALRRVGEGFEVTAARPPGYDRPWARAPSAPGEPGEAVPPARPRDATPRADDLEPGD